MLISFFKKSFITQYIALILINGILWLPAFLSADYFQQSFANVQAPAYILLQWLFYGRPLAAIITAFLLVLFSGLILNYALIQNGLSAKNSLLPALLFYILAAHQPWMLQLHPTLIPVFILTLTLPLLFELYVEREAYSQVFHTGFLLAIATLFYLPMIFFIPMVFFTFMVYRLFKWREWIILILGFLTVFLFTLMAYFWFDRLPEFYEWMGSISFRVQWMLAPKLSIGGYIIEGVLLILFIMAFLVLISRLNEKIISIRKKFWAVIWLLITASISLLLNGINIESHLLLLLLPISVILSYYLSEIPKTLWMNIALLILFFLILFNNFYSIVQLKYF